MNLRQVQTHTDPRDPVTDAGERCPLAATARFDGLHVALKIRSRGILTSHPDWSAQRRVKSNTYLEIIEVYRVRSNGKLPSRGVIISH